jgi:general nucleoside transport system ATP-binding protein
MPGDSAGPSTPALSLQGICKRFGALRANHDISLTLARGEVLALLGENGAGKSTLVSILFGHYVADAGQIEVFGEALPPGNPKAALAAGIGMVHQHFTLADNLSVLDNLMLGTEPLWQWRSTRGSARAAVLEAAQRFGLQVDPDAMVASLSVGERQRVEILKALVPLGRRRGARILILDEPTAVLTPAEAESLFETLAQLVAQGLSIIFISHKLDEVLRVSDRIAVLRAGELVTTLDAAQADKAQLAEWMVGRQVAPPVRRKHQQGSRVCALHDATAHSAQTGQTLAGVNLQLHAGEIVAIAGVAGHGQQVLAEVLFGLQALDSGHVMLKGQAMPAKPRDWIRAGVARVPEDRHAVGVVGDMAVWENVMLERYATPVFATAGVIRRGTAQAQAQVVIRRFDVRGTEGRGPDMPTRALSGGNMQKLILGRALAGDPSSRQVPCLIVADQPTWGLDIGAVAYVHQQLIDACAHGAAVLVISEDLDEIFAIADHVAVMHRGRLSEALPASQWTMARIGLAMTGQQERSEPPQLNDTQARHAH